MTIQDLQAILQKHKVDTSYYRIMEQRPMVGEIYIDLTETQGEYLAKTIERMQVIAERHFSDEASACQYVLKELAYDYPVLKQYFC